MESNSRTSALSRRSRTSTSGGGVMLALRRMLAMRLLAAVRLADSGSSRKVLSALRRASKSSGEAGRAARTPTELSRGSSGLSGRGGAPPPERILGPRVLLPDGEDAGEGVELVGDGEREARARGGQLIAGRPRQVVLADRRGHLVRLTVRLRVVGTHDALQLGKLAHHGGEQIALAQLRGAHRVLG